VALPLTEKPRLAISLAAATLVPIVALVWLGVRVLQQDRDMARQRARERLEVSAGRLALDIERRLQGIEERIDNGRGIRLSKEGLDSDPDLPVLFQPFEADGRTVTDPAFLAAEALEFQHRNLVTAAAAYRQLARSADATVRAASLVALARVLRQQGSGTAALATYAELLQLGPLAVGSQPAALIALQGRCKVFEETSNFARRRTNWRWPSIMESGEWIARPLTCMAICLRDGMASQRRPMRSHGPKRPFNSGSCGGPAISHSEADASFIPTTGPCSRCG
jgi:hypothetical protein